MISPIPPNPPTHPCPSNLPQPPPRTPIHTHVNKDNSSFNARVIIIILLSRDLNHNFVRFFSLPSEAVSRARKRANLSREGSNAEIVQSQVVTSQAFTSQFSQASNRADFFFLSIIFAAKKSSKTLRLSFKNLRLLVFAKKMSKI